MSRIIFSVWSNLDQPWGKHKNKLMSLHKKYAELCDADYYVFEAQLDYDDLMFYKISVAEFLVERYDEVLYLDMDVVPKTKYSFFDMHDFDNVCLHRTLGPKWKINLKQMMLINENVKGNDFICNTGVLGLNKKSAHKLNFRKRLEDTKRLHDEVDIENLYSPNNEVYISYIIEKYKIPFKDIGIQWNFILDHTFYSETAACHFVHYSNKELLSGL